MTTFMACLLTAGILATHTEAEGLLTESPLKSRFRSSTKNFNLTSLGKGVLNPKMPKYKKN